MKVCEGFIVTGGKEGDTPDDAYGLDMRVVEKVGNETYSN